MLRKKLVPEPQQTASFRIWCKHNETPPKNCYAEDTHPRQSAPIQNTLFVDDQRSDLPGVHVRNGFYMAVVKPAKDYTGIMAA